ncbi:MAG: CDP-alcohol phosphatidyltransferase family protein [Sedimentisphaeraceae bacterium JB056]
MQEKSKSKAISTGSSNRRRFLRKVRKKRLKYIAVLPSLITLLNCVFGFASMCLASKGFQDGEPMFRLHDLEFTNLGLAGLMIFIAMIMDVLDGRVARMSQTTSSFGGQLDSLSDIVSFGIAPAFLMWQFLKHEFENAVTLPAMGESLFFRFIWFSAAIYLACTAIRLARFNVENEEDESAHMYFVGIPSPAAAGVLTSLIVFQQRLFLNPGPDSILSQVFEVTVSYTLPLIAIGLGILMISRIKYPHLLNLIFKGQKPVVTLIWCVGIIAMIFVSLSISLVVSFCGFAMYSLLSSMKNRKNKWIRKPIITQSEKTESEK